MKQSLASDSLTPDLRAVQRARRSRDARTQPGRGRRLDLLLDQRATAALLQLSRVWNESLTATVSRSLAQSKVRRQEQRKLTVLATGSDDPADASIRQLVQRMRTRAWFQAVRLGLNASTSAELEREIARRRRVVVPEGSWSKYARGSRHPSESVRNIADAAIPGSAELYETGPYGSLLWVALLGKAPDQLWRVIFHHYPSVAKLKSELRPFGEIVAALRNLAASTPAGEPDPQWPLQPTKLALPDMRDSKRLGQPNEYCLVAALIALYRLSGLLYQPEHAQGLYELLCMRVLDHLRGAYGQLALQNPLDAVVRELNHGMPRGSFERQYERLFGATPPTFEELIIGLGGPTT